MKATDQPDTFSLYVTKVLLSDGELLDLYDWEYRDAADWYHEGTAYSAREAAQQAEPFGYREGHSLTLSSPAKID